MIAGMITPYREAEILLQVRGPSGSEETITAVIDTGFNENLTLPPPVVARLGLAYRGPVRATLADGRVTILRNYRAVVIWNGRPRDITVLEADSASLAGMALLYGSRVTLDVIDGGAVTIAPLP
jgi:clan AA aspartic protease